MSGSLLYYGEILWSTSEKVWMCHNFDQRSFVQMHVQDHWKKKRITCVRSIPFLERNISSYFSKRLFITWECVMIFIQVHLCIVKVIVNSYIIPVIYWRLNDQLTFKNQIVLNSNANTIKFVFNPVRLFLIGFVKSNIIRFSILFIPIG